MNRLVIVDLVSEVPKEERIAIRCASHSLHLEDQKDHCSEQWRARVSQRCAWLSRTAMATSSAGSARTAGWPRHAATELAELAMVPYVAEQPSRDAAVEPILERQGQRPQGLVKQNSFLQKELRHIKVTMKKPQKKEIAGFRDHGEVVARFWTLQVHPMAWSWYARHDQGRLQGQVQEKPYGRQRSKTRLGTPSRADFWGSPAV